MSKYGATLTVLATGLIEATVKDESEGFDIGAGLFGENQSEWLRKTAEEISGEKCESDLITLDDGLPEWFCSSLTTTGEPPIKGCIYFHGKCGCNKKDDCNYQVPF